MKTSCNYERMVIKMKSFKLTEDNVRVLGRSIYRDGIRYLSYSCAAVEFIFTGTRVTAEIWTDWAINEGWEDIFQGYASVIVDDDFDNMKRFAIEKGINTYPIFESDTIKTVKIRIVKMSEAAFGKMGIISIDADGDIKPTVRKKIGIEFIGDSITCGYGIEGVFGTDTFNTRQENPWTAYAATTARNLDFEYQLISWSGIGVISGFIEADVNEPLNDWLMPALYDYTDRGLENILGVTTDESKEIWDNSVFAPEICVVNLGTNDNSYTRNIVERVDAFGELYIAFLQKIREKNPNAYIICTLGAMGQELFPEIEKRVMEFNDSKVSAMMFDVQKDEDSIGSDWHPSFNTHQKMAAKLTEYIKENCIF